MPEFFDKLDQIVVTVNDFLSDYVLLFLLLGCGLFFTIRTRFVQIRCFGEGFKNMFSGLSLNGKSAGKGGMSSFQALATAIAAQVGTGNIVGASAAILVGGPGAIFWMWLIAFFGMATIYAEAVLAQKTKETDQNGEVIGGPVFYIKKAFKGTFGKVFAGIFSVAAILALGLMGVMVQSNSIGESMNTAFGIPTWIIGVVVAAIALLVFLGGMKAIASFTEKVVPIMALLYIIGCLIVIFVRIQYIPESIGMIFKYAFRPDAIIGGAFGAAFKMALTQGAKRGLFSNEAGMGSTPHAHAVAKVDQPHTQGTVAMTGVFIDTFVILTLTALVIISTLFAGHNGLEGVAGLESTNLAQAAFSTVFGEKVGSIFVAVCLFFFALSTIVGWNFFGRLNVDYLFKGKKVAIIVYSILSAGFVFMGTMMKNGLVWHLQDFFDMLIALPNIVAIVVLGSVVAAEAIQGKRIAKELAMKKAAEEAGSSEEHHD